MTDAELIKSIGAANLARILGFNDSGGVQRVHNWISRGIPARMRLARPDVFARLEKQKEAA